MVSNESYQPSLQNGNGHQPPQPQMPIYAPALPQPHLEEEDSLDLQQFFSVIKRRWLWLLTVSLAVSIGVGAKVLSQDPVYAGKFQLLLEPITEEPDLGVEALAGSSNPLAPKEDYETRIEVLASDQVLTPILQEIQAEYPDLDYETLLEDLSITRLGETKILTVSYQASDPERIEYVLERIAQGYVNFSLAQQQSSSQQGLQFVGEQLPQLRQRVDTLQEELQRFRQHYNLIDPQSQGQLVSSKLSEVLQERQNAQIQLGEAQSVYQNLSGQLGLNVNQAVAVSALSEAPRYQSLLNELQKVETQIATESTRFTANSPSLVALQEQRRNLLPLLRQEAVAVLGMDSAGSTNGILSASPNEIRLDLTQQLIDTTNEMLLLNVRQQALGMAENQMRQQVEQMAVVIRQYTDLQRELEVATASLNRFLEVREELEIESSQKAQPWQLISTIKVPEIPISPNIPRGLLLGAVAGLLAGTGAALLVEKLDSTFHSPEELKEVTGLPILGTIPYLRELKGQTVGTDQPPKVVSFGRYQVSPFTDAFRSLHTNLYFVSPDKSLKSLVVSSSLPSEGKSTTSVNLARAAAAMGQRVLLVDADLRCPQIHVRLDIPNVWGLSNVISTDLKLDDVIQRSPMEENLYVLTAGQIPPDPTPLISSNKMQNLVKELEGSFDLVIFDMPPMLGLADAKILAPHTDGMLFVVGLNKTERSVLKSVLDSIQISRANVLGIVANGVKNYAATSSYYRNYYASIE